MSILYQNLMAARNPIIFVLASGFLSTMLMKRYVLTHQVFGLDGNGGHMLKIITDLTDEEIAKLKFAKRVSWHAPTKTRFSHTIVPISDQELQDRGIKVEPEKFIQYNKRPPHDKFL